MPDWIGCFVDLDRAQPTTHTIRLAARSLPIVKDHRGQADVFIVPPDQENTLIFRINQIRMQSKPYRTWPVPRVLIPLNYNVHNVPFSLTESIREV